VTVGCIGVLEALYKQELLADLRAVYGRLLAQDFRIDAKALQLSLRKFGLEPF
jgi:predicted nucleic acid-binding protein